MTLPPENVLDRPDRWTDSTSAARLCGMITAPSAAPASIGEALRFVRMSGVFYCPSELTEPWGLALPAMPDCVWFHAVVGGACTLEVEGEHHDLGPGDIVLVPHGTGHRAWGREAADTPIVLDLPHEYVNEHYAILRHGGGGDRTDIICGGIRLDHPAADLLVQALPRLIRVDATRSSPFDSIRSTIEQMAEEVRRPSVGAEAVISRLCDIVVIQAIRSWIDRDPAARSGWLGALHDEQIGAAMARIHAEPERDWTVAALAGEVAMSRSAFAARFTELVGEPAMRYVTRWRMHVALDLLRSRGATVSAAARAVGYDSEAAFSRAYKRVMGEPPRTARATAS